MIAQLYRVEKQARQLTAQERLRLRQIYARPILEKLHQYLLEIQAEVLPKSPEGRAVRYALKNWTALSRYSRRRRSGNRQHRHGAQHSWCGGGSRQLDVFWQ